MKLSEIQLGKEYAIVPSWTYNQASARDIDKVRENDVVKATVTSLEKYEYEPSQRRNDSTGFTKAQSGNRSVGILVKATDNSGTDFYWTSRLADVVAEVSVLEPKWNAKKSAEEEANRKRIEQQNLENEHHRKVEEELERSRHSIISSSKELLGEQTSVDVSNYGYGLERKVVVNVSLREFEQLLELAYEGKA